MKTLKWGGAVALTAWLLSGCGGGPNVVEVSGTVTRNGEPVPHLFVNFIPEQGRPSWGRTNADGRYTLNYAPGQDGALVGPHTITVNFQPKDPREEIEMLAGRLKMPQDLKAILTKYGDVQKSPLHVTVEKQGQVIDLALD